MTTLLMPIIEETFEEHFTNNGWTSLQDQIDAGYTMFIEPLAGSATFEQVVDLEGVVSAQTLISANISRTDIKGALTIVPTLSVSEDGVSYTDYTNVVSVYASNFRYVKIKLEATGTDSLARINDIQLVVYLKEVRDQGSGSAVASDASGTIVNFNKTFIDISSIIITPEHQSGETKGITGVYNFDDVSNPTSFKALLFSNNTGSRIDGAFRWQVVGY